MQNVKLDTLLGEKVSICCNDRSESEFTGEFIGHDSVGILLNYWDHGREFVTYFPYSALIYIDHKRAKEGDDELAEEEELSKK